MSLVNAVGAGGTLRALGSCIRSLGVGFQPHLYIVWRFIFVFAGYYFGSKIGFALTFHPYSVSTLWPTNAILLASLVISPTRIWPLLILAAFPAHLLVQLQTNVPPGMVFCWFISNSSEALIGAGLIRRFLHNPVRFDIFREFNLFLFFAVLAAPFLSSFIDTAFVKLNGFDSQGYWHIWKMRFFSNVLAGLTFVPALVAWKNTKKEEIRKVPLAKWAEAFVLIAGLSTVTLFVFNDADTTSSNPGWIYLPLPFLLWAAARFGFNALSPSILIVSLVAIWGAIHNRGPFHISNPIDNTFYLQMFVIVFSYPLLLLTSLLQERKQIRETALENEERFRLALSAAKMNTWDMFIPTDEKAKLEEYKVALSSEIAGDYLNFDSYSTLHPDDRTNVLETIGRAIAEKGTFEVEFRVLLASGEVLWKLGKGEIVQDNQGRTVRVLGVNVDISARKKAEEERRKAELLAQEQKLELYHLSRVGVLGELSGTVAHELNQPLTAILSNAQAAQRYLKKGWIDVSELRHILDNVIEQDRRAGNVIKGMRALLKKEVIERHPVNLNHIVKDVLHLANGEFITHNIILKTQFQSDLPLLKGDRIQLQQVLLNLLMNAVESMSNVDVSKRFLNVTTGCTNSMIQALVSDTGTGIPPDMVPRIFEPFHTTKQHGLGLGLSISRAIIVAHGGQLQVINNSEGGATFSLSLPVMSQ